VEAPRPARPDVQKKTAHASEQARADVKAARENWFDGQDDLDPERLIFIDESGLSTKMARLRGWAPKGQQNNCCRNSSEWVKSTRPVKRRPLRVAFDNYLSCTPIRPVLPNFRWDDRFLLNLRG
jgi:hypothetical protein